jgi:hypothetical protein
MTKSYRQLYNLDNGVEEKLSINCLLQFYGNAVVCSLTTKSPRNAGLKPMASERAAAASLKEDLVSRTKSPREKQPQRDIGGVLFKEQTVTPRRESQSNLPPPVDTAAGRNASAAVSPP